MKKILAAILLLTLVAALIPAAAVSAAAPGAVQVATAAELVDLVSKINDSGNTDFTKDTDIILTADIDLSSVSATWVPISVYSGTFNGAGHTISNLTFERKAENNAANNLAGTPYVIKAIPDAEAIANDDNCYGIAAISALIIKLDGGSVRNLTIKDSSVFYNCSYNKNYRTDIAFLAGYAVNSLIYNCKFENVDLTTTAEINRNQKYVGYAALAVARAENLRIENTSANADSSVDASPAGRLEAAGLVGIVTGTALYAGNTDDAAVSVNASPATMSYMYTKNCEVATGVAGDGYKSLPSGAVTTSGYTDVANGDETGAFNNKGTAYYWNDQNWCGSNVTVNAVKKSIADGSYLINFGATGACTFGFQLFYNNPAAVEGAKYELSMNIYSATAESVTVNGVVCNIVPGNNSVKAVYTATNTHTDAVVSMSDIDIQVNVNNQSFCELILSDIVCERFIEITAGKDTDRLISTAEDLVITTSASDITGVKLNGTLIGSDKYTVNGSTVTIKASYLSTLAANEYTVTVVSTDGEAATSLTVATGDIAPVILLIALASLAAAAVIAKKRAAIKG